MMVFKYTDGAEELEEEDFIECEDLFGDGDDNSDGSKFIMKGGLKVDLSGTEYNTILTCYQDAESKLSVKMLKNKSYGLGLSASVSEPVSGMDPQSTWEPLKAKILQAIKKDEQPEVFEALLVDVRNFMTELERTG